MSLFPRFQRDRGELAYGFGAVTIAGVNVGRGVRPVWLTADQVIFGDADGPGLFIAFRSRNWQPERLTSEPISLVEAGAGRYAKWQLNVGIQTNDGGFYPDGFVPTMNADGVLAFLADPNSPQQTLYLIDGDDRVLIDSGASLFAPNLGRQGLVWSRLEGGRFTTYGWRSSVGKAQRLQASFSPEFDPVVVDTPDGPWVLAHDDAQRLLLYPWGRTLGIVVETGVTYNPDGIWTQDGWQVAWTNAQNAIVSRFVPYSTLRRELTTEPPRPIPTVEPFRQPLHVGALLADGSEPGNCYAIKIDPNVSVLIDTASQRQIYTFVEGGDLETIRTRVLLAKGLRDLPVIAGADSRDRNWFPQRIEGASHVAWEVYPATVNEPASEVQRRVQQLGFNQGDGLPVFLIACAYDVNGWYTGPIQPLLEAATNLARSNPGVDGYLYFAGKARAGYRPELAPYFEAVTRAAKVPTIPDQPEEQPMEPQPYPDEAPGEFWDDVRNETVKLYTDPKPQGAGKPLDDKYPLIAFARTAYDIARGMTKEASWKKHRAELRAELKLTPEGPR